MTKFCRFTLYIKYLHGYQNAFLLPLRLHRCINIVTMSLNVYIGGLRLTKPTTEFSVCIHYLARVVNIEFDTCKSSI